MLKIGRYEDESRVVVAPMAGVTDQPFRNICRSLGAHWLVSEMVTSDRRLWHTRKSALRLRYDEPGPRWVQIAGADPAMMADAARSTEALGAQIIDINMGCPAKKVCNRAAGSALLRDERLVGRILDAVVAAVAIPVTLKMRLGWSPQERNAVRVARIAESAGVQLITVHGRSRACKFEGDVDYRAIAEVKAAVDVPVLANGDITSAWQAAEVLEMTGCDGIMIGRAMQGRPWLAAEIDAYLRRSRIDKKPDSSEIKRLVIAHVKELHQFYGEVAGVRIARKHVGWYLREPVAGDFRKRFNRLESPQEQLRELKRSLCTQQELVA